MTDPLISVIVPVWNGAAVIERCLTALETQILPRDDFEIILVDNGSTDETVEIARRFPDVMLLSEPKPGSYGARNRGLTYARGSYIAFTDADCVPVRDWLARALAAAEANKGFGVLAGRIELFDEEKPEAAVFGDYERLFSFPQSYAARGNCATANWMSPRAVLEQVGGFDERLKSGGDRDMALRIKAAGLSLVHVPAMIVRHPVRASRSALVRKRRRLSGGRWDRTRRTPRLPRVLWATLYDTGRRLRRAALAPDLPMPRKLAVMALTVELSGIAAGEFWRLSRGQGAARD